MCEFKNGDFFTQPVEQSNLLSSGIFVILPWTRDPLSIEVISSRGILDDIPPPIYHAQSKLNMEFPIKVAMFCAPPCSVTIWKLVLMLRWY